MLACGGLSNWKGKNDEGEKKIQKQIDNQKKEVEMQRYDSEIMKGKKKKVRRGGDSNTEKEVKK